MIERIFALTVLFLILLLCDGLKIEEHPGQDGYELVFTSILYRHGERTPEGPYPNDPYKNESYWPPGWGMLTDNGKRQHYELGKWLRNRYLPLMPGGKYSKSLVYVRSTDGDRTLMSALSNLAGMFYPTAEELWTTLEWQPIPVHTIPMKLDKLLVMGYPCPKYQEQLEALYKSSLMKSFTQKEQTLYDYLTKNAGEPVDAPIKVLYLYSTLYIQTLNNYTLPDWAQAVFPERMYDIAAFAYKLPVLTRTLKRLYSGPLLKEIINYMKAKRSGTLSPNRNMSVYSAHDVTVASLLETMGVFHTHLPPFAATVLVELRRKNHQYFVSVHYKNSTEEPSLLTIPGCKPSCPLDQFESILSDFIPWDWDAECQESTRNSNFVQGIKEIKENELKTKRFIDHEKNHNLQVAEVKLQ